MAAQRWGNTDLASNTSGQFAITTFNKPTVNPSGVATAGVANAGGLYHNSTPSAFTNGQVVGLYGVTKTMLGVTDLTNAGEATKAPGWVLVRRGSGPIKTVAVNAPGGSPGNLYTNTDYAVISSTGATVNASYNVTTTASGNLASLAVNNAGFGFTNTSTLTTNFYAANGAASNGTGGTLTITLGGRAGRVQSEVLVVTPTMQSASSTVLFPAT